MQGSQELLSDKDLAKLSHILSYALRHNPLKYNLVPIKKAGRL